jgi:hypothetical protein
MKAKPKLYQCPECGLHYRDIAATKKCQAWCTKYKSCNLEIAKLSGEAKAHKRLTKLKAN